MKKEILAQTFRLHQTNFIGINLFTTFTPPRPNNIIISHIEALLKSQNGYEAGDQLEQLALAFWPFEINNLTVRKILTNRTTQNLWLMTTDFILKSDFKIFCKGVVLTLDTIPSFL